MSKRVHRAAGIRLAAALLVLAVAASPALAEHGKGRGERRSHRPHERHQVVREARHPRHHAAREVRHRPRWHRHGAGRQVVVRPRVHHVYHHGIPRWCASPRRVVYYHDNPFYYHAGFDVFLGGAALGFDIARVAPAGYAYVDPYCGHGYSTVDAFRFHVRSHRHPAVLDVVLVDGGGSSCHGGHGDYAGGHLDGPYEVDYRYD
jgi:hypothetical protein